MAHKYLNNQPSPDEYMWHWIEPTRTMTHEQPSLCLIVAYPMQQDENQQPNIHACGVFVMSFMSSQKLWKTGDFQ